MNEEEARLLLGRIAAGRELPSPLPGTVAEAAEFAGVDPGDAQGELELIRAESRLAELDREREEERRRLAEIKAEREAAARAKETPEDAEAKHQAWLERQRLFYERDRAPEDEAPPTPERVRRGWQAVDALDDEKPARQRNPMLPLLYIVIALVAFCFVMQIFSSVAGGGRSPTQRAAPK